MTSWEQGAGAPSAERDLVNVMDEVTRRFNGVTAVQELWVASLGRLTQVLRPAT